MPRKQQGWITFNAEVTLEIAPGVEITSLITRASADKLELVEGKEAYAVIKSTNLTSSPP